MPPGPSPKDDDERIYACPHCPKRYVRKDYLERHELNHTRPSSVCPACGKGFARPDVLRKHLFTSCKSRRTGDGDPPPPLTTAEEDALVPRKRRRPQRRLTIPGVNDAVPPLRMASHGHPAMTNGHRPVSVHARTHSHPHAVAHPALSDGLDELSRSHGHNNHHHGSQNHGQSHLPFHHHHHQGPHVHPPPDHQGFSVSPTPSDVTTESGAPGSSSGLPGQTSAYGAHHQPQYGNGSRLDHYRVVQRLSGPPASSPLDHHDPQSGMPLLSPQQSQPRYPQHLQHHQVPTPSQLPHGHPHPRQHQSPDHRLGPARAGGSLEVLLAPAFAATPETTFGFGFAAPKDNGDWQNANPPPHAGGLPHSLPPPHGVPGVHGGSGIQFDQQRNWAQPTAVDNNGLETSAGVAVQQGFGVAGLSPDLPVPTTTGDASSKTYSSTGNRGASAS
ncbi:Transcriptional regulator MET32 [Vanrija pseudolonga]|uniref:Transcriptional regulator MET32 n=1 Tax=Vanrija pseudolonga TaxID=143232 RepID=A0AAF0YAX1_9TREE|nr:Transcriptional regulator MET32 [Vanrija pseudolonga]